MSTALAELKARLERARGVPARRPREARAKAAAVAAATTALEDYQRELNWLSADLYYEGWKLEQGGAPSHALAWRGSLSDIAGQLSEPTRDGTPGEDTADAWDWDEPELDIRELSGFQRLCLAEQAVAKVRSWGGSFEQRFTELVTEAQRLRDYEEDEGSWEDCHPNPWTPEEQLGAAELLELRINNDKAQLIKQLEGAGLRVHPELRQPYRVG